MNHICILEDELINKIAAGEVVERPASIVKELVENAIDAKSTNISVALEDGGVKSILVEDNGAGIYKEDMTLALQRHATSKIRDMNDLFCVMSMGFRGEALASISAVSSFTLVSKQKESEKAYKLSNPKESKGPLLVEWNRKDGTSVLVEDLFYNVPVRAKFLRSAQTEFAHCYEFLQALCFARPCLGFSLLHNGKEKLRVDAQKKQDSKDGFNGEQIIRNRVSSVLGREQTSNLLYIQSSNQYGKIEALISPPGEEKATSKSMFFFVNHRWVKDKVLRFGVLRGYHSHLLKGKYPIVVCYISIEPELVDVNVHPNKSELRFQYGNEIQSLLAQAIRERLRKEDWSLSESYDSVIKVDKDQEHRASTQSFSFKKQGLSDRRFGLSSNPLNTHKLRSMETDLSTAKKGNEQASNFEICDNYDNEDKQDDFLEHLQESEKKKIDWSQLDFLGSFSKCYLFFQDREDLLVLDQHAFHERILYEKLCDHSSLLLEKQSLIIPEAILLDMKKVSKLKEFQRDLSKISICYNIISDQEVEVTALPSLLKNKNLDDLFHEISEKDYVQTSGEIAHTLLATIACHSAVRAGDDLSNEQVLRLLSQADDVDFTANCPHGRRVFKWIKKNEVKKWFDRI